MSATGEPATSTGTTGAGRSRSGSRPRKAMTIGTVCKILDREFPDISISKIRYLEDQKLLSPRRTRGGYRLYSQADVERLRTILALQRDEFLPLRVIRQELASADYAAPRPEARPGGPPASAMRRAISVSGDDPNLLDREALLEQAGAPESLLRELEDFGLIAVERGVDGIVYTETDREILRAVAELATHGVQARNLRAFRSSADREASLLEQIVGPTLRSRNPERRKQATETLEQLAGVASRLQHLLLVRSLRRLTGG